MLTELEDAYSFSIVNPGRRLGMLFDIPSSSLARLDFAKVRWRIERDYQEFKQEVGLGHFEGRGCRGFHHHATVCIAHRVLPTRLRSVARV
jgi:SRSO17 transposase